MSAENGWNGWAEAWTADAESTVSDVDAIERRVRTHRALQRFRAGSDVVASLVAVGVSVWVIIDGEAIGVVLGLAGLAFSLFSLAVTLGRRRVPNAMASRTVAAALAWEIATTRSSARASVGGMVMAVLSLMFLALCTVVFDHEGLLDRDPRAVWWLTAAGVFGVGSGLTSLWLYRRRRARVAGLERMLAELTEET